MLQNRVSFLVPLQSLPPLAGVGLLQLRTRACVPLPQVLEHGAQSDHTESPPSTAVNFSICNVVNHN